MLIFTNYDLVAMYFVSVPSN